MKFTVTIAGLAARMATARIERMRNEVVRTTLAELAWRASGRQPVDDELAQEVAPPDGPPVSGNTDQQRR